MKLKFIYMMLICLFPPVGVLVYSTTELARALAVCTCSIIMAAMYTAQEFYLRTSDTPFHINNQVSEATQVQVLEAQIKDLQRRYRLQ